MFILYLSKILGLMLAAFGITLWIPTLISFIYNDSLLNDFALSSLALTGIGLVFWFPFRKVIHETYAKEGFLIIVILWLTLCSIGTIPFLLIKTPNINLIDAIFETISGITATGATVLTNLDNMPRSLIFYRQQLQFLGGMGIILLAVAILPSLGAGGMQLMRAELTGSIKEKRLTPRIAQTAKSLWLIYFWLTVICAISYWGAGMSMFDAICYSFGTVSTGGFAPHDKSIEFYQSHGIEIIAIFFMLLGAVNYSLHYLSLRTNSILHYFKDAEFKTFFYFLLAAIFLICYVLMRYHNINDLGSTFLSTVFHVVSLGTTTGFAADNYYLWPTFIPVFLLILGMIGGCSGSTSGGVKIIRALLLLKIGFKEIRTLVHPHAHHIIKVDRVPIQEQTMYAIWGFIAMYIIIFGVVFLCLLATGLDFLTSYSASIATLSNVGPGLGLVAENYQSINPIAKAILSFAMIIGRLEFFTILVLFSPEYWRS